MIKLSQLKSQPEFGCLTDEEILSISTPENPIYDDRAEVAAADGRGAFSRSFDNATVQIKQLSSKIMIKSGAKL
ncbi:MAG: hypothetical protein NTV00_11745, partial [Methylococcales bacterium]|nr:hypothetical protein [Methylococcales bacterium]